MVEAPRSRFAEQFVQVAVRLVQVDARPPFWTEQLGICSGAVYEPTICADPVPRYRRLPARQQRVEEWVRAQHLALVAGAKRVTSAAVCALDDELGR